MEARVAKLEASAEYVQREVSELRRSVADLSAVVSSMRQDVATIKERLNHTPTSLQMWLAVLAVIAPIGGGLWWMVQQYLAPILAKAAGLAG